MNNNKNNYKDNHLSGKEDRYIKNRLRQLATLHKEANTQHNSQQLLQFLAQSTCKILGIKYCVLGMVGVGEKHKNKEYVATNILKAKGSADKVIKLGQAAIKQILSSTSVLMIDQCLATAIYTNSELYGYLYIKIKLDGEKFNAHDRVILGLIASEIALIYENNQFQQIFKKQKNIINDGSAGTKKILAELNIAQDLLRGFSEHTKDVFWETNPTFSKILYINRAYEDVWGRSRESLYQNPSGWLEAVLPEDRKK